MKFGRVLARTCNTSVGEERDASLWVDVEGNARLAFSDGQSRWGFFGMFSWNCGLA